jgi:Uma2 family endonuclease
MDSMTMQFATKVYSTEISSPSKDRMIGEELFVLGDIGRAELVKGELIRMMPHEYRHGFIEVNFGAVLGIHVDQHKLGRVLSGEIGIYTNHNPDTVRGADVAFISNERLAQVQSQSYLDVAPELIVEIFSPDDSWSEVNEKLEEYLAIGVQVVWVADPRRQQVHVYHSLTEIERLTAEDTLAGGEVLPGFSVPASELFGEV